MLDLVLDPSWIHRRVESVEFIGADRIRRRVSLDFSIPEHRSIGGWWAGPRRHAIMHLVPLGRHERGQALLGLDIRDEAGASLPLLEKSETDWITWSMLVAGLEEVLPLAGRDPNLEAKLEDAVEELAFAPGKTCAEQARDDIFSLRADGWPFIGTEGEVLKALVNDLAENFLFVVRAADAWGRRRVLKYAFEMWLPWPPKITAEQFRQTGSRMGWLTLPQAHIVAWTQRRLRTVGWKSTPFPVDIRSHAIASTYHLEIRAPEGAEWAPGGRVAYSSSLDPRAKEVRVYPFQTRTLAHLVIAHAAPDARARLTLQMHAPVRATVRAAALAIWLTSIFLILGAWWPGEVTRLQGTAASTAATILLAIIGLASFFAARTDEHMFVTRLLFGIRTLAVWAGLLAYAGAIALVLSLHSTSLLTTWRVLSCAVSVLAIIIAMTWVATQRRRLPD